MSQGAGVRFDEAVEAYRAGNMPKALLALHAALQSEPKWPLKGHILHAGATIASEIGEHKYALFWWTQFLAEYNGQEFPPLKLATSYYDAAYTERLVGDIGGALTHYSAALEMFRTVDGGQPYIVKTLQNMAWAECMGGGSSAASKAALYLEEAAPLATEGDLMYHQLVGEAFLYSVSNRREQALAVVDTLLNSQADDVVKAQSCYVGGKASLSDHNRDDINDWRLKMREYVEKSQRRSDLMFDLRNLESVWR